MSRALVIGAQGVIGSAVSQLFFEAGWQVVRAGRRPEDAPDFQLLDLDDPPALSRACADADVVVNTVHHPELAPERTVLREGGTLIELSELSMEERNQLILEGVEARGLVVTDTGLGGAAYLAIAELLRDYPEADGAEYSLMFSASGSGGRAGALFAHSLLTGSSRKPTATIPFPEPVGTRRCLQVAPANDGALRETVAGVPIRHFLYMHPAPLNNLFLALNRLRVSSLLPAAMFTAGTGKASSELSGEYICEWVGITEGTRRLAAIAIEGCGYYRMTAVATLAFGEALERWPTEKRGLQSIDQVLTLDAIRPHLNGHWVSLREQLPQ